MNKERILGFDVCTADKKELIKEIFDDFINQKQSIIFNINPEIVINNYKDVVYKEKINKEKYQIPDGIGIVYASKINNGNITQRIAGIDFMYSIIEESIKYNLKIFLYGAKSGVAEAAKEELEKKYTGINIVGVCDGYVDENIAIQKINKANPDILFVGLGSPKQDNFIFNNREKLKNVKIIMPVGGSFDVVSNKLKRAPEWIIKLNLEWLYRLIKQPKRIFRQLKLFKFIFCVLIEKFKRKGEEKKCQK